MVPDPPDPDRENGTDVMRGQYHSAICNPNGAMEKAKALLRVADHLDADTHKKRTEPMLFYGPIVVIPTLLRLATELALKALHMRDQGTSPQSHDPLKLFDLAAREDEATPRTGDAWGAASTPATYR